MNPDAAILIENVTRSYAISAGFARPTRNLVAVDDISLSVRAGSTLGIVGESGCGKSTLAQMIVGLLAPTSGRILVDGQSLAAMDRRKRAKLIQLVPQDPFSSLNPKRRIRDNIALPLTAQAELPRKAQMERVREMMERVGLRADMGDRYPAELSGGQRQRVAIARALVNDPRVVVCDEPTSALDVSVQAQILNLLAKLQRELNLTLVFISHNLSVVEYVSTEVAVMYLGRIVEYATADDLFCSSRHPYSKALLNSVLTPETGKGIPLNILGEPPDPSNIPAGCRFRPRCAAAQDSCRVSAPERLSGIGSAECHFA